MKRIGFSSKGANRWMAIVLILLSIPLRLFPQDSEGWLYIAHAPAYTTWKPTDIVEAKEGDLFVAFLNHQKNSHILKLSKEGEKEAELEVSAQDTAIFVSRLFANGVNCNEYSAIALCIPESDSASAIMTLMFDEDLNVLQRKVVSCGGLSQPVFDHRVLKLDHNFIIAVTDNNRSHYLIKSDLTGEILEWKKLELDSLRYVCNLFKVFGERESSFGMYANVSNASTKAMGTLVFDDSLQLISRVYFDQWQNEEENGRICLSYLYDAINSMMMPLPDSSGYLISSQLRESLYTSSFAPIKHDRSAIIAKTDLDFVIQDNYVVVGHLNDTLERPAYYKSVDYHPDFVCQNGVYQCTIQGVENDSGWPMGMTSLGVIVTKVDEDINVLWKKRFLCGNEKEYYPFAITATHDGGCAVTGMVFDYNQERRLDLFVLRIAADGTVGLDEIQEESMAFVYPNPAKETFTIGGVEAKETQVYNTLGQRVMTFSGNAANVEALSEGVYLLWITDSDGFTQTIRLIVGGL